MSIEDSQAEGDDEVVEEAQPAAEGEPKGQPAKPRGRSFVAGSTPLDDLLRSSALTSFEKASASLDALMRNSSVLTSFEKAFDSFNWVNDYFESTRRLLEQSGAAAAIERMQADFARTVDSSSRVAALAASMRWVDQLTPQNNYLDQVTATSRLAEQIAGSGALTSWRSALEANSRIEAQLRELMEPSPVLSELARISRVQVDLTDWAVQHAPGKGLLSETSGMPVVAWRNFVSDSADHLDELPMVVVTGRTNLSLLGSDLLASPDADPGLVAEGADRVESEVVEPWMAARLEVTAELYAVLTRVDAKVPELLNGAWDDIRRNGPAAAEKVANCTVEAVERALRQAAPDEAVRAWHAENNRPAKEWEGLDKPPHALRVKYLVRNLGGPRPLVESQAAAFASVVGRLRKQLQATKHASIGDVVAVRTLLITAESLLISLFVGQDFTES
ncbi:hypothetical protein G3I60_21495 [Streptomyces sp. SID13666]|uniref:hypothetical protein n=1 Tax=unclassified Streptomyces TaxID=2593676 RepID=UPI0013BFA045|nr:MULTISPECIES: hypothetical protein [unclassified Streptomyces]NEA56641.1 hypothetical protein [Streptomyces sp. SID13666]NEA73085.1 hypothetical protein [Streptomyces sp. SID13588]